MAKVPNTTWFPMTVTSHPPTHGLDNRTTHEGAFYFYQHEQLTFLYVLFVLVTVGNSLVILTVLLSKHRRSRVNFFILNLAFADLAVGIVNVLTDLIWKSVIEFHAGDTGCRIVRFLQGTVTYASTYALVALSLDRLHAVSRPLAFHNTERRSRLLVLSAWMLSILFSSPMLVINSQQVVEGHVQCWTDFPHKWMWKVYVTVIALILFVLPAIIIAICYIVIVVTIWRRSTPLMRSSQSMNRIERNGGVTSASKEIRLKNSKVSSSHGVIPRAKVKTIKMTLVIVLVFILCWSPYFVYDLLDVYGHIKMTQDTVAMATFIQSLAPLNSAANPVIYGLFNTKICLGLIYRRCRPESSSPGLSYATNL